VHLPQAQRREKAGPSGSGALSSFLPQRFDLMCPSRNHGERLASKRHELNLIALPAAVDQDNGADIPGLQPVLREILGERDLLKQLHR